MPIELLDKQKKIHIVPYSHHDHAWFNTREWHIRRFTGFFLEALDEMRRNRDLTFMVDNAAHSLAPFVRYCPDMLPEFQRRMREGRIEIMNGGYALARPNYVGEETFIRNLAAGALYFTETMGADPIDTYINTDTSAGHSQLPQILKLSGINYCAFYRPEHQFEKAGIPRELCGRVWTEAVSSSTGHPVRIFRELRLDVPGYDKEWNTVKKGFMTASSLIGSPSSCDG